MTDKQKRFCDEYIIDCNATRAYKAAYPKIKNDDVAKKAGSRLLTFVDVKAYIDEQLEKISSAKIADATEVMEYLTCVLRGESDDEDNCPTVKDRLKAAELLGKRHGLFADKLNISGTLSTEQSTL